MANERLQAALAAFDAENAKDPSSIATAAGPRPKELVHAERLSEWVRRLEPRPSEALLLAARCQHIQRWHIPRSDFPEGRVGYLKWRKQLAQFHADTAATILRDVGYDDTTIDAVRAINLKQGLKSNADTQTMEDALCLSFLEHEFDAFAERYDDAKLIDILQKTWRKMSERGHQAALALKLSPKAQELVARALAS